MDGVVAAILTGVGFVAVWLLGFWYLYILVIGLYRAYLSGRLKGPALWLSAPALAIGFVVDLVSNWTLASLLFFELPRSPLELVTDRLTRHIKYGDGWRRDFADSICVSMLDFFDPAGRHCR